MLAMNSLKMSDSCRKPRTNHSPLLHSAPFYRPLLFVKTRPLHTRCGCCSDRCYSGK